MLKLYQFGKRVTAGIGAGNTLTFWTPRSGSPQNDTPMGTGIRSVSESGLERMPRLRTQSFVAESQ